MLNILFISLLTTLTAFNNILYINNNGVKRLLTSFNIYMANTDVKDVNVKNRARSRALLLHTDYMDGTGGRCSATSIGNNTALTAKHCVSDSGNHFVILTDKTVFPAKLYNVNPDVDLATLESNGLHAEQIVVGEARVGEYIFLIGQPLEQDFEEAESIVFAVGISVDPSGKLVPAIFFTCGNVRSGFSGSALYNNKGEIVGVMSFMWGGQICVATPFYN